MQDFDPQNIIERFQDGEWLDDADYWAVYLASRKEQTAITLLAERRWRVTTSDVPGNSSQAVIFDKEDLAAIHAKDTAYLNRLLRAIRLLKHGRPKWSFSKLALIKLAIIHSHENLDLPSIDTDELHELVAAWQRANQDRKTSDKTRWYAIIKLPEIRKLLKHRRLPIRAPRAFLWK